MLTAISQASLILAAVAGVWSDQLPFKVIATGILVINAAVVLFEAHDKAASE
jgi:hypothetical protein